MTDAELRAYIVSTRATIDAELAQLDALEHEAMPQMLRLRIAALRQEYLELRDSLSDHSADAEHAPASSASRNLTLADLCAMLQKH
ncbi:MAG: hypothetical protein AB7V27_16385 [Candidatus Binatia bacterium]